MGDAGYFGDDEEPTVARFAHRIAAGGTALDIGVGQGRNALALARRGLRTTGIDAAAAAIDATAARAAREGLDVALWCGSFEAFAPGAPFDAVLAFGLLQEMTLEQGATLCARLRQWCAPGGLVFVVAWQTGDPRCRAPEVAAELIGPNSVRRDGARTSARRRTARASRSRRAGRSQTGLTRAGSAALGRAQRSVRIRRPIRRDPPRPAPAHGPIDRRRRSRPRSTA